MPISEMVIRTIIMGKMRFTIEQYQKKIIPGKNSRQPC